MTGPAPVTRRTPTARRSSPGQRSGAWAVAEQQLDLSLPAEGGTPVTSVGLTMVAVAASAVREIRVADAALRARIAAGQTLALFGVDERAVRRFWEFFAADLRNANTRAAYLAAVYRFADWCEGRGLSLTTLEPAAVAAYVELLGRECAAATVKLTCRRSGDCSTGS